MRGSKLTVSRAWIGHKGPAGTNMAWTHPAYPGVVVKHCGHPTALRPYHIPGRWPTFRTLKQAQWWVEHGGHELELADAAGEEALYGRMLDAEEGMVA